MALSECRNAVQLIGVKGFDVRDRDSEQNLDRLALAISVLDTQIGSYSTILDIMSKIREGECKLPQDKIYGCLGMIKLLVNKDFANSIPPDHSDAIELFKTFFLRYIQKYKTLRLLETAGLCQVSSLGGPSWLPDWTTRMSPLDQRLDLAVSLGMAPEVQYDGGDILTVTGVIATQVRTVDILKHTGDLSSANFGKSCEEIRRLARVHLSPGLDRQIDALTRALTAPMNGLRVPMENVEPSRGIHQDLVRHIVQMGDMTCLEREISKQALNQFANCIRYHQQHRTLFIFTEDGHVGISLTGAKAGDFVAAILGMNNLLLLRPSPNSREDESRCQLAGSCSIHGLNWGEALLGPLPANFTVILQLSGPVRNFLPFFQDLETGQSTFWDPRIDWTELDVKPTDGPSYKIIAPPGEPERHVSTADFFRRYGTKLTRIEWI